MRKLLAIIILTITLIGCGKKLPTFETVKKDLLNNELKVMEKSVLGDSKYSTIKLSEEEIDKIKEDTKFVNKEKNKIEFKLILTTYEEEFEYKYKIKVNYKKYEEGWKIDKIYVDQDYDFTIKLIKGIGKDKLWELITSSDMQMSGKFEEKQKRGFVTLRYIDFSEMKLVNLKILKDNLDLENETQYFELEVTILDHKFTNKKFKGTISFKLHKGRDGWYLKERNKTINEFK